MHLPTLLTLSSLPPLTLATTASLTYPLTIEIDLLSPLNKTYNANSTSPPLILALQNIRAAYAYEWSIHWAIWESSFPSSEIPGLSGTATSGVGGNEFLYYFGDVGVVPMRNGGLVQLQRGGYRLEWDYAASPCVPEGKNAVSSQTRTPVASGTSYFSIVEDGTGSDFDLPVGDGDGCPAFGGSWEVEEEGGCPVGDTDGGAAVLDGDSACKARLTERGQVDCIWEFLTTGRNETETCLGAFERVDPDWSMYYTPGEGGGKGNGSGDGGGGSESNGTGTGTGSGTGTGTGAGDSKGGVGASQPSGLSGLALGMFGAVAAVMAL